MREESLFRDERPWESVVASMKTGFSCWFKLGHPAAFSIIICQAKSEVLWARFWFSCQQRLMDDRSVWTSKYRWTRQGGTAEPVGISSGTTVSLLAGIDRSTEPYRASRQFVSVSMIDGECVFTLQGRQAGACPTRTAARRCRRRSRWSLRDWGAIERGREWWVVPAALQGCDP